MVMPYRKGEMIESVVHNVLGEFMSVYIMAIRWRMNT